MVGFVGIEVFRVGANFSVYLPLPLAGNPGFQTTGGEARGAALKWALAPTQPRISCCAPRNPSSFVFGSGIEPREHRFERVYICHFFAPLCNVCWWRLEVCAALKLPPLPPNLHLKDSKTSSQHSHHLCQGGSRSSESEK